MLTVKLLLAIAIAAWLQAAGRNVVYKRDRRGPSVLGPCITLVIFALIV